MRMKNVRDVDTMVSAIQSRQPLTSAGAISGTPMYEGRMGQLRPDLRTDRVRNAQYILYSYETPMAWLTPEGWVMPDIRYSRTTSCHQGTIRQAIRMVSELAGPAPRLDSEAALNRALDDIAARLEVTREALQDVERMDRALAEDRADLSPVDAARYARQQAQAHAHFMATPVRDDPDAKHYRGLLADRGDYIAAESSPYDRDGRWHTRSHP